MNDVAFWRIHTEVSESKKIVIRLSVTTPKLFILLQGFMKFVPFLLVSSGYIIQQVIIISRPKQNIFCWYFKKSYSLTFLFNYYNVNNVVHSYLTFIMIPVVWCSPILTYVLNIDIFRETYTHTHILIYTYIYNSFQFINWTWAKLRETYRKMTECICKVVKLEILK